MYFRQDREGASEEVTLKLIDPSQADRGDMAIETVDDITRQGVILYKRNGLDNR